MNFDFFFSQLSAKDYFFQRCYICSRNICGRENYVDHLKGRQHTENLRVLGIEPETDTGQIESPTLHSNHTATTSEEKTNEENVSNGKRGKREEENDETSFDEESLEREYEQAAVEVFNFGYWNCRWCKVRCSSVEILNLVIVFDCVWLFRFSTFKFSFFLVLINLKL
jgi:hypothetical protein